MTTSNCPECSGTRLRKSARNVFIDNRRIEDIVCMPVGDCCDYFENLICQAAKEKSPRKSLKKFVNRFNFLVDVGLNYLSLNRSADTLSGGEAQRIRLASQIGAGLVGVMYISR